MSTVRVNNLQNPSAASPAIVLAADGTATATVSAINSGPLAGMRNAIVNGSFDHWQRGTSQTTGGYGSADRWRINANGTFEFSRQPFTLGQTAVPGNPKYHARMSVTVAPSSSNTNFSQRIEGVDTFSGQQVTLSFWAKANATRTIWAGHFQSYGTGGSPSATTNTDGGYFTLTTSWQRFSLTTTLPSVSGKTLGTDGNDHLTCHFIVSADNTNVAWASVPAQTGTFDFAQIQLEAGPVATPFERRPIGVELALCQRYYCMVGTAGLQRHGTGYITSTTAAAIMTPFPVAMRVAPDSLEQSGTAADYQLTHGNNATICSAVPTFTVASPFSAVTTFTVASGLTVGQGAMSRNNGGGGYLAWSAEL